MVVQSFAGRGGDAALHKPYSVRMAPAILRGDRGGAGYHTAAHRRSRQTAEVGWEAACPLWSGSRSNRTPANLDSATAHAVELRSAGAVPIYAVTQF